MSNKVGPLLVVTESLEVGGAERQGLQVAEQLRDRGARVEFAVLGRGGPLAEELERSGIPWRAHPRRGPVDPACILGLARRLRQGGFTAVEGLLHLSNVYATLSGALAGTPVRVACNVGDRSIFEREGQATRRWTKRIAYRLANRIMANSHFVGREDPQLAGQRHKLHVIHNGLRESAFEAVGPAALPAGMTQPVACGVGRLVSAKDYPSFLRTVAAARRELPSLSAVIVGGGPLEQELRELATELGLDGAVHFTGMVPDPRPWLAASDLFLMTSARESLPNALMEAMAQGLPVVATAAAGIPELVEEGGTGELAPVGDVEALGAALARLGADPALRASMGARARERARAEFHWDVILPRFEELFRPE